MLLVLQLLEWLVHLHVQLITVNLQKNEHVYEKNSNGLEERALGSDLVMSKTGLLLAAFQC